MTDQEIRQQNRMVNSTAYLQAGASDWASGSRPARALVALPQITAQITVIGAQQAGGGRGQKGGTATKSALLAEITADSLAISRTAELIAKEENDPNFAQKFARLDSRAGERVVSVTTDFLELLQDPATWSKFEAEGMRPDLRAELAADLAAYPTARDGQAAGRLESTGATDELDDLVHQAMAIIDGLDTYFGNLYAKNKTKLDTWKTASRLERGPVRAIVPPLK